MTISSAYGFSISRFHELQPILTVKYINAFLSLRLHRHPPLHPRLPWRIMTDTFALAIPVSGPFTKTVTVDIPVESGIAGEVETVVLGYLAAKGASTGTSVKVSASSKGLEFSGEIHVGPFHKTFDLTEQLGAVPDLIAEDALGSGKTESVDVTVVKNPVTA